MRVFEEDAYADRAFASEAKDLDARDRAFAQRIAYGAIQMVRTLDHAIERLGGRPVGAMDAPVRAAIRLGAYELAFLGGVPARASVNEAVELVKASPARRAAGFANAVLRRVSDGIRELIAGLPESTPQEAALRHSYPDWVAETWWEEWGADEALALMRAQNEPPETAVRVVAHRRGARRRPHRSGRARARRGVAAEPRLAAGGRCSGRPARGPGAGPVRGARRQDHAARPLGIGSRRRGAPSGPGSGARGERAPARVLQRSRRQRRCTRPRAGAVRVRPRARGRPVLGARRACRQAGPALAREAAPRAAVRAAPRRGGTGEAGRHDRLLGLHDREAGERGRRRLRRACRSSRWARSGRSSRTPDSPNFS